ncbi:MAG TPA: hypothetical protein VFC63_19370 [Blastocatellia bacterium]|nr:hypothetical protein [Blastocatellia bacterium]
MTSKDLPPSYVGTTRLLNRKYQIGRRKIKGEKPIIECTQIEANKPEFWHIPGQRGRNLHNWQHEKRCGDVYVSYETVGALNFWTDGHHEEYDDYGLIPDRVSRVLNRIVFWEVERETKLLPTFEDKCPKYVRLSRAHPGKKMYVIWTVITKGRLDNLLSLTPPHPGLMFLIAFQDEVLADPLGAVLRSPKVANPLRLEDLEC